MCILGTQFTLRGATQGEFLTECYGLCFFANVTIFQSTIEKPTLFMWYNIKIAQAGVICVGNLTCDE